ncbi:ABC transporter permease [Actinomadura sp. KC06]|uniref:ABC transporter permease n=1 Tax=Actinomadura sp. KC06 TaxID=2530369 RepID=UPI001048BE5C|nr:ABC transporter permease [Actinomadura sp. KC06]TDD33881.1 ABC transporter permease [Actinomadura sp. KC06]
MVGARLGRDSALPDRLGGVMGRPVVSTPVAVVLALVAGGALMVIAGGDPVSGYRALLDSAFGSPYGVGQVLTVAVPLVLIGLGLALAFRGRVYNIGAEGQLFMGALASGTTAIMLPAGSAPVLISASLAAGVAGGAAWAYAVGVLRARWGVNVVITSLLLNYVATLIFSYVIRKPLRDPSTTSALKGEQVPAGAVLPDLPGLQVHAGALAVLVLVPLIWYVSARTPFGFQVRMLGLNEEAAQAAGVPSGRMVVRLMLISGGLAGLAGALQVLGVSDRLDPDLSQGYGFTAIVVALLGRLQAPGVLVAGLLLAALVTGGQGMSVTEGLPYAIVAAITGVFVVFLLIADRFGRE